MDPPATAEEDAIADAWTSTSVVLRACPGRRGGAADPWPRVLLSGTGALHLLGPGQKDSSKGRWRFSWQRRTGRGHPAPRARLGGAPGRRRAPEPSAGRRACGDGHGPSAASTQPTPCSSGLLGASQPPRGTAGRSCSCQHLGLPRFSSINAYVPCGFQLSLWFHLAPFSGPRALPTRAAGLYTGAVRSRTRLPIFLRGCPSLWY